jgi:hypothetical protein
MSEQERHQPDSKKDQYPPDANFGRQAARDAETIEKLAEHGAVGAGLPDLGPDDQAGPPRAASKAEPAPAERAGTVNDSSSTVSDEVDDASDDSFPASDPPSSTGSTPGG